MDKETRLRELASEMSALLGKPYMLFADGTVVVGSWPVRGYPMGGGGACGGTYDMPSVAYVGAGGAGGATYVSEGTLAIGHGGGEAPPQ